MIPQIVPFDPNYVHLMHAWTNSLPSDSGEIVTNRLLEFPSVIKLDSDIRKPIEGPQAKMINRVLENRQHLIGSIIVPNGRGVGIVTIATCIPINMRPQVVISTHSGVSAESKQVYEAMGINHFLHILAQSEDSTVPNLRSFCEEFGRHHTLEECRPDFIFGRIASGLVG